ncbi:auxin-responsive protein IAA1-like [Hibiscus syriacus]|uniref:auxin-responsive protein IAA1-like n=1 Tax=Hibiscus syriacus TaxID=106335 RepID=UPI0019236EDC|nr:auxin-responsive protein IAA1-like [Hibiscus syriacus]
MVSEEALNSPESDVTSMSFEETELTLGLPGEGRSSQAAAVVAVKCFTKHGFLYLSVSDHKSGAGESSPSKEQVVGWPPVRSCRKKGINERFEYVKVGMDGAPYLRKLNLQGCSNYLELFKDLEKLFNCSTISGKREENKLMDDVEYVPTYEDKDSDWMLVEDVPYMMFIESCKRIRLMKCSEVAVLASESKGSSISNLEA